LQPQEHNAVITQSISINRITRQLAGPCYTSYVISLL